MNHPTLAAFCLCSKHEGFLHVFVLLKCQEEKESLSWTKGSEVKKSSMYTLWCKRGVLREAKFLCTIAAPRSTLFGAPRWCAVSREDTRNCETAAC